ncbi:unnamed protein product [Mytilus coruscus]|uniref:Mutator-like transposase domain-containing protein n=1 Tax=Mytilus coruscus TaxID=42192 RepID=A0A6J8CZD6_MYTCO|nr:unnamed protein product [Mytilus coruscus]
MPELNDSHQCREVDHFIINLSCENCHPVDEPTIEDHNYLHVNTESVLSDLELGASCTVDPSQNDDWKTGRRIVELQCTNLAQQMYCISCDARLHLSDIENERRYGLGRTLFIRCQNSVCSSLNDVRTRKRNSGTFDINSRLALGNHNVFDVYIKIPYKKTRCFMYAIKECQWTKDPESLRKSLDIIVPHLYGDHSRCANEDVTWCSYQKNPSQFRYRSLPEGKPLTCPSLRTDLTAIVNKAVGLSPGEFTYKMALKTAAKRKLQKAKQISLQAKRKRLLKKISKSRKEATKEIHEGVTYSEAAELHQEEEFPHRLKLPENPFTYVVFDTETTGGEIVTFCR